MSAPPEAWAIAMVVASVASYVWGFKTRPTHRPGCNECSADRRRTEAAEREATHDTMHRGLKAPGFPYPTEDIYDCADIHCPRNKRNRPGP